MECPHRNPDFNLAKVPAPLTHFGEGVKNPVRRIVGISTYGSPRSYVRLVNDNGRRTLCRALRVSAGARTRTRWLGCYGMDTTTPEERADFAADVERTMADLR